MDPKRIVKLIVLVVVGAAIGGMLSVICVAVGIEILGLRKLNSFTPLQAKQLVLAEQGVLMGGVILGALIGARKIDRPPTPPRKK